MNSISESIIQVVRLSSCANQKEEVVASHGLSCKYSIQINLSYTLYLNQFSPDGTIAVVMTSGAFDDYANAGFRFAGPFTEAKYLVSMQDFVYESPGNRVLTRDNVNV